MMEPGPKDTLDIGASMRVLLSPFKAEANVLSS